MLEIALAARVSPETLRKIESGRVATPAFSTIAAIAAVLDLSLDALWAEINQPERGGEPAGPGRNARVRPASANAPNTSTSSSRPTTKPTPSPTTGPTTAPHSKPHNPRRINTALH